MPLINNSFTFVTCSDCKRTIKIEVGQDIKAVKCECEDIPKVVEKPVEEKPKRTVRRKADNATSLI